MIKIKARVQEESVVEKRNTSLLNFTAIAIIPIGLAYALGFFTSSAQSNHSEYQAANLTVTEQNNQQLHETILLLQDDIDKTEKKFLQLDSLLVELIEPAFDERDQDIRSIEDKRSYDQWSDALEDARDRFSMAMRRASNSIQVKDERLMEVSLLAQDWLTEIERAKSYDLQCQAESQFTSLQLTEEEQDAQADRSELQALEKENQELRDEISSLENRLQGIEQRSSTRQELTSRDFKDKEEEIEDLTKDLLACRTECQEEAQVVMAAGQTINREVEGIEEELKRLEGQGFLNLKNNKEEARNLRDDIKDKLENIQRIIVTKLEPR